MITREQAALFAAFARTIRREWDELATINILVDHKDKHPTDIFRALINAATNPNANTPKAIDWAEHWQPTKPGNTDDKARNETEKRARCKVDGHSGIASNCPQCRSELIAPKDPKPCPEPGHHYWSHNCLDCRRESAAASA